MKKIYRDRLNSIGWKLCFMELPSVLILKFDYKQNLPVDG
jgi:hypothetical protein